MARRLIAALLLVGSLVVVMVAPAAAQEDFSDDIEDVYLISEGSVRDFYIVEVSANVRTTAEGQAICELVGLDKYIGADRYRIEGDRYTDVTCAGDDEPLLLTIEATIDGGIPYDADYDIYVADDLNDSTGSGGSCAGDDVDSGITGSDGVDVIFLPAGTYCIDVQEYEPDTVEDNIVFVIDYPAENYVLAEFTSEDGE